MTQTRTGTRGETDSGTHGETLAGTLPPIHKSIRVRASADRAFVFFSTRMADWWPLTSFSVFGAKMARLEGPSGPGVEIVEHSVDGGRCAWGRVLVWEPPQRLVFSFGAWHGEERATEVEVTFTATDDGSTEVELIHRGWERLGDDAGKQHASYRGGWDTVFVERFGAFVAREA